MSKIYLNGSKFIHINSMYDPTDEGHTKGIADYFKDSLESMRENTTSVLKKESLTFEITLLEKEVVGNWGQKCVLEPVQQKLTDELMRERLQKSSKTRMEEKIPLSQLCLEHAFKKLGFTDEQVKAISEGRGDQIINSSKIVSNKDEIINNVQLNTYRVYSKKNRILFRRN